MDEQPAEGGCVSTQMEQTEEGASRGVLFREVNEYIAELSGDWRPQEEVRDERSAA